MFHTLPCDGDKDKHHDKDEHEDEFEEEMVLQTTMNNMNMQPNTTYDPQPQMESAMD
jgi:hypothetical protein